MTVWRALTAGVCVCVGGEGVEKLFLNDNILVFKFLRKSSIIENLNYPISIVVSEI